VPQPYRLWTFRTSPFAGKARAAFAEKGVPLELVEIHPVRRPPRLRELNPVNRVPVLELDGVAVRDSSLICEWLEEVHPEPALWPADPDRRAWARGWGKWLDEVPVRNFFLGMRKLAFGMGPEDPEDIVERLLGRMPEQWPVLEQALGVHAGPWLVGEQFTYADVSGMALAVRLPQWRPDLQPAGEEHPRAAAWLAALRDRPSAAAIDAAGPERLSA
jgi:glutathione S-transferase